MSNKLRITDKANFSIEKSDPAPVQGNVTPVELPTAAIMVQFNGQVKMVELVAGEGLTTVDVGTFGIGLGLISINPGKFVARDDS